MSICSGVGIQYFSAPAFSLGSFTPGLYECSGRPMCKATVTSSSTPPLHALGFSFGDSFVGEFSKQLINGRGWTWAIWLSFGKRLRGSKGEETEEVSEGSIHACYKASYIQSIKAKQYK